MSVAVAAITVKLHVPYVLRRSEIGNGFESKTGGGETAALL